MVVYQAVQVVGCVFLGVVFITGVCGNYLVTSAVLHFSNLRSATNYILVNLAVVDILGCLINLPIMITVLVMDFRSDVIKPLSDVNFVSSVSIGNVIIACHVLLCIDRYDSIVSPFNQRITKTRMKKVSIGLLCYFLVVLITSTIFVLLVDTHWLLIVDSTPHYVAGEVINGAGISTLSLTIFIMLYTFTILKRNLKRHRITMSKMRRSNLDQRARLLREARILKVALIVVLSFAVTTFPWIVVRLLYSITGHERKETFIICYSILYSGHSVNPVVYASFMQNLRRGMRARFVRLVPRVLHRRGNEVAHLDS